MPFDLMANSEGAKPNAKPKRPSFGASSQSRLPPREGAAGAGAAAGGAAADEAPNDGRRAFALGFAPSLLAMRSNGMVH